MKLRNRYLWVLMGGIATLAVGFVLYLVGLFPDFRHDAGFVAMAGLVVGIASRTVIESVRRRGPDGPSP